MAETSRNVITSGWELRRASMFAPIGSTFEATEQALAEYEELRQIHDPLGCAVDQFIRERLITAEP